MISQIGFSFVLGGLISSFINIMFFAYYFKNRILKKNVLLFSSRFNFIFILIAFILLMIGYIISDFTNINVFYNSHTDKPLLYKISGVWSNHEGSLLLWILIMSLYTFIFSYEKKLDDKSKYYTIFFQSIMIFGFLLFMILTSNPFLIISNNVTQGMGLNPILQDPALAIHPPLLYFGYVGFSLVLSLAVASMISNEINKNCLKTMDNYALFCWSMLTLGICVGSFWAYYELGWGGWWFWDPVENASLMPWLSGLALIHSLKIAKHNSQLKRWIVFLSILCFSLSLIGTFLVRSGILMSVHAFANDSSRGIFILMLFLVITGFSFLIFLFKAPKQNYNLNLLLLNKTSSIIINNIIMTTACFTVLLGTIYPLIIESINNNRISVGAPYFNSTVLPILLPGLILMAIGPALTWNDNGIKKVLHHFNILLLIIIFFILIYVFSKTNPWGIIGISLGIWIISASVLEIYKRKILLKNKNLYDICISISSLISHIGVGILILGITASSVWKKEFVEIISVGEIIQIDKHELKFEQLKTFKMQNYETIKGKFILKKNGEIIGKIEPEKRYYPVSKTITTEAGIFHKLFQDIYIVIGNTNSSGLSTIKVYQNPLVSFIWVGALLMAIGGFFSMRKK